MLVGGSARYLEVNARASSRVLELRDLGAPVTAAYAQVPVGAEVTLIMTSGGRATLLDADWRLGVGLRVRRGARRRRA